MPLELTCVSYALTTIGLAHHMSVNYSCHPNFVDARTYMVSSIFQMATIVATPALPMRVLTYDVERFPKWQL